MASPRTVQFLSELTLDEKVSRALWLSANIRLTDCREPDLAAGRPEHVGNRTSSTIEHPLIQGEQKSLLSANSIVARSHLLHGSRS